MTDRAKPRKERRKKRKAEEAVDAVEETTPALEEAPAAFEDAVCSAAARGGRTGPHICAGQAFASLFAADKAVALEPTQEQAPLPRARRWTERVARLAVGWRRLVPNDPPIAAGCDGRDDGRGCRRCRECARAVPRFALTAAAVDDEQEILKNKKRKKKKEPTAEEQAVVSECECEECLPCAHQKTGGGKVEAHRVRRGSAR